MQRGEMCIRQLFGFTSRSAGQGCSNNRHNANITEIFPDTRHCEMTEEFVGIYIVYKVIDSFSWRLLSTEAITVDVVNDIISLSSQA
jgi:hypothetical protein